MSNAFWISPQGKVTDVGISHIEGVLRNPDKFGLSTEYINSVFQKHGEERWTEGDAREEIIKELLQRGYIRIRKYGNHGYSVNVWTLMGRLSSVLRSWAQGMLLNAQGFFGMKETDRHAEVSVVPVGQGNVFKTTIGQLAAYGLRSESTSDNDEKAVVSPLQLQDWPSLPVRDPVSIMVEKVRSGISPKDALPG